MESGLVGLRAELQKKRAEASKHVPGQRGPLGRQREAPKAKAFSTSNAGVSGRAARDEEQHQAGKKTEENARQALERKAAMYDKLHQGVEVLESDSLNQKFLVNFQKKIVDDVLERKKVRVEREAARKQKQKEREEANPEVYDAGGVDDEWVEYVDTFGRTRECLRAELPERLQQEKQLSQDLNPLEEPQESRTLDPRQLEDLHRESLRQKWEREETINATKKDLHYQDVLYDEARTHGTSFLKFSRDEKERKAQMELLRDLRTEAKQAEASTASAKAKRQKAMQARLEKVRQRKRLKMGLPMKDDDKLKTPPGSEGEEDEEPEVEPTPPPPSSPPRKKTGGVREWDLGKEGITSTLTQEEWVLRQRSERQQEFAPPSTYHGRQDRNQTTTTTSHDIPSEDRVRQNTPSPPPDSREPFREGRRPDFAPPATHEYYGPASTRGRKHHRAPPIDLEAAITKGLKHLRKMSN